MSEHIMDVVDQSSDISTPPVKISDNENLDLLERHVRTLLAGLEHERAEELMRWRDNSVNSTDLEKQGYAFRNLIVSAITIASYGSIMIRFAPPNRKVLGANQISIGDVLAIYASVKGCYDNYTNVSESCDSWGYVEAITDESVTVCVVKFKGIDEIKDNLYMLRKLPNNMSYTRLKWAVHRLTKNPEEARYLTDLLFGEGKLEQIPINPSLLSKNGTLMYKNESLNNDQKEGIEFALKQKNLAIIHGPPGTGKTSTLAELIYQLTKSGDRVLVCAPSNVAVDTLMSKFSCYKVNMVRLGHPSRIDPGNQSYTVDRLFDSSFQAPPLRDAKDELRTVAMKVMGTCTHAEMPNLLARLKELRHEIKRREKKMAREVLLGVSVCFATLASAHRDNIQRYFPDKFFSTLVIDEASQASEPDCWLSIPLAKRCVLAGDHLQLPPVVLSKEALKLGLDYTLMERFINKFGSNCFRMLTCQYRMNAAIMDWVSENMYGGRLIADPSVAYRLLCDMEEIKSLEETDLPLVLIDTSGCRLNEHEYHSSYGNLGEADLVAFITGELVLAGLGQKDIAIITPYKRQVDCIKDTLKPLRLWDLEVKTVDGFQGREKEAVVLSLVRSNAIGEIGFLADRRRLNVAVSRAKRFLCVVADVQTVQHDPTCRSLVKYLVQHGEARSAHEYGDEVTNAKIAKLPASAAVPNKKPLLPKPVAQFSPSTPDCNELRRLVIVDEHSLIVEDFSTVHSFNRLRLIDEVEAGLRKKRRGRRKPRSREVAPVAVKESGSFLDVESLKLCLRKLTSSSVKELKLGVDVTHIEECCVQQTAMEMGFEVSNVQNDGVTTHMIFKKVPEAGVCVESTKIESVINNFNICGISEGLIDKFSAATDDSSLWNKILLAVPIREAEEPEVPIPEVPIPEVLPYVPIPDVPIPESTVPEQAAIPKQGRNRKKGKKQILEEEDGNNACGSDEYLDAVIKKGGICAYLGCKVSVRLLGHDCTLCRHRFCIGHTLPEIHGCAENAKKAARKAFVKPPPKPLTQEKKKALKKTLDKKLSEMSSSRKGN